MRGQVSKKKLSDFRPQAVNANKHNPRGLGMLDNSIAQDGWLGAITTAADGETFDGSARLETAYTRFGDVEPIVIEADGSRPVIVKRIDIPNAADPKAKRLAIAANRVAEVDLQWDADVLAELSEEIDLSGLFFEDELAELLNAEDVQVDDEPADEDDEEALAEQLEKADSGEIESRVSLGQIWKLGRHYICCGDSTDEGNIQGLLSNAGVDKVGVVWADPPYGIAIVATNGFVGGGEAYDIPFGGVKNRPRSPDVGGGESYKAKHGVYPIQAKRLGSSNTAKPFGSRDVRGSDGASNMIEVGKYAPIIGDDTIETAVNSATVALNLFPKAVQFWWGGNYYASALPNSSCWIVWDKQNTGNFADAELAWTNQGTAVRIFQHMWNGLMKASEKGQRRVHPTQKPIALAEWAFEKYGKSDDAIFDPFLGSGMSIIAAQQMEGTRKVIGFELSPEYCEVICRRFEAFTGINAELVGSL
jgi:hypothetical protein